MSVYTKTSESKQLQLSFSYKTFDSKINVVSSYDYEYFSGYVRETYRKNPKDSTVKFDEGIYRSLQYYEKQVGYLKGQLKVLQFHQNRELKMLVFDRINNYANNAPVPCEPLTEEEAAQWKILSSSPTHARELCELIEHKVENERREQEEFL